MEEKCVDEIVSGPAVVLLSMSPSYVGESSASSLTISRARACLAATPAVTPAVPFARPIAPRPDARRPELGISEMETADAPLSVSGSLSSSEAS